MLEQSFGAGEGIRTLDMQLGKLPLYRLSYSRDTAMVAGFKKRRKHDLRRFWWAGMDSNHRTQCERIYSPSPLTTRTPAQVFVMSFKNVHEFRSGSQIKIGSSRMA
jgi:hypothetical protein